MNAAFDLFAQPSSECVQLFADAEGGVRYWPSIIAPERAHDWFGRLLQLSWGTLRRQMYDREVDVPRMLFHRRLDDVDCPSLLHEILRAVQAVAPAPYNAAGLNLYRDGRDSVAMHGDKLRMLAPGFPIAIVSLGDPRVMLIRARAGTRATRRIGLVPGSLLLMSHASQRTHEHGIPKTARPVGSRMSVVSRVRP